MYYAGEFRSLDTSQDPRGSLYKVLIFTGYDSTALNPTNLFRSGTMTNVGPYPTKSVVAGWAQEVGTGRWFRLYANVPSEPVQLTMTSHPVKINYVGDGKLQKPYRCSTAELSFLQSTLNTDFINSLGQRVLVYVLKWKNEVQLTNANTYKNTITNETLSRTVKQYNDPLTERLVKYYNDFIPWEKDNFCYDVVWAGFSTPEMLNTAFDHIVDKFTLQCQDALSTLKYTRFTRTDQMESMLDTLLRGLLTLGIYRNVYVTSNVHFAGATNDLDAMGTTNGPALRFMGHQQDNFFDEDGIAMYYLDVFENMMNYLGLTMIPEGDSLYITNDHCIGNGHTDYKKFSLDSGNFLWAIPASNPTYGTGVDVDCADTVQLNGDKFCSSSTTLSSNVMVNKVSVECDEMRPDPLLPDWKDDAIIAPESTSANQPLSYNFWRMNYNQSSHEWFSDNYYYWEAYFMRPLESDNLKLYKYLYHSNNSSGAWRTMAWNETSSGNITITKSEVVDADLEVLFGQQIRTANGHPRPYYLKGVIWEAHNSSQYFPTHNDISACAFIMDFFGTSVSSATTVPNVVNFTRKILLVGQYNASPYRKETASQTGKNHDWDDKNTYWQPLVYMKSKPFLGNGKQWLNITGDWVFYYGSGGDTYDHPDPNCTYWYPIPPTEYYGGDNYALYYNQYAFIWAKVKCGDYYLKSSGFGNYTWDTEEGPTKLWFTRNQTESTNCAGVKYSFQDTTRGIEGISLELPVMEGYAEPLQIEMWIDRPLGPSNKACASATVEDLALNIYSDEYVASRKRRNPDRDNTRYENEVVQGAVEEAPRVDLIHSSCDTAGLSYAETTFRTIRRRTAGVVVHRTNPEVLNDGSGYYGIPEKVRINTDKHQGITPSIKVDTGVFNDNIHMHSRFLWNSQLNGHKFILDSAEIDLEYEQCNITLLEVKAPDATYANIDRMNATRNYHRTRDIMFDGHVALRNPVRLTISHVTGNEIDYEDAPEVVLTTDERAVGASTFNMDWATGEFRLTAPSSGGIAASVNNNHQVVVSTN